MRDLDDFTLFGAGIAAGVGAMLIGTIPGLGALAFAGCATCILTVILRRTEA